MNRMERVEKSGGELDKDRLIEELREAVRARDEFVAIAAHELRNPMTPILLQVHRVLASARRSDRCRPEILVPQVELLEQAVNEFVRRATALLDVSRVAAGNIRIQATETDLSRVVLDVVARLASTARMVRCRVEPNLREGVVGMWDRLAVEQIVENLLSNALKFGAGQPVNVGLWSNGRTARLTVRDRGIGISEEDRARIFDRFERAVVRREHGGFGVGLWLANQLVVAMNGTIRLESVPGEGASFTVELPVAAIGRQDGPE
jgi:two-component system OmpR family sensor kinase